MPETVRLPFTKMQAVGNDFVVLAAHEWPGDTDWPATTIRLCDRRFGIGSDGLMLWETAEKADLRARMWNPDGTEDMCGNGTRCVVHLAYQAGKIPATGTIETLAGVLAYGVNQDGSITIDMGIPKFAPEDIPMTPPKTESLCFSFPFGLSVLADAVNTGSTHLVCYLHPDQIAASSWKDRDWFTEASSKLENARRFPERTSVMWTYGEDNHSLRIRIWERGVGETLGCGTGACAAAIAARRRSLVLAGDIFVHSKGGTLRVGWEGKDSDPMYLTGTAHITYTGTVDGKS